MSDDATEVDMRKCVMKRLLAIDERITQVSSDIIRQRASSGNIMVFGNELIAAGNDVVEYAEFCVPPGILEGSVIDGREQSGS